MEIVFPALVTIGYCFHLAAAFIEYDIRFHQPRNGADAAHEAKRGRLALRFVILGCLCCSTAYLSKLIALFAP